MKRVEYRKRLILQSFYVPFHVFFILHSLVDARGQLLHGEMSTMRQNQRSVLTDFS